MLRILGDISEQEMHAYSNTRVQGKLVRVFGVIIFLWACLPWDEWETRRREKERGREDFQVDK